VIGIKCKIDCRESLAVTRFPENLIVPTYLVECLPIAQTSFFFSSLKFLLALVAGVVMAFAFQLLFTNLAIAVVTGPDSLSNDSDSAKMAQRAKNV
jgi:hypothetical protein